MLGHEMGWETPWDALDEIARLTPTTPGVSSERIGRKGPQWPMRPDGSDSPTLYDTSSTAPAARGQFAALPYKAPGDARRRRVPAGARHRPASSSTTTPGR